MFRYGILFCLVVGLFLVEENSVNNVEVYLTYPMADLADRCWADILVQAKNQDLFEPVSVVMPNRNLQRWFQMYIAKKGHTATQIKFLYVETAIKELFGSLVQNQSIEVFSRATLRNEILFLLYSDFYSTKSKWPHLLGKIESNDNQRLHTQLEAEKIATMTRLFQVANQLARHFEDYQYHRASSLEEWKLASSSPLSDLFHDSRFHSDLNSEEYPLYLEQQSLYQTLYSKLKQSGGPDQISLNELLQQLNTSADTPPSKPRSPLFLFGLSLLSRYHISCFQLLSDYFPIKFYLPDLAPFCFNQSTDQQPANWSNQKFTRPSRSQETHPVLNWVNPILDMFSIMDSSIKESGKGIDWYRRTGFELKTPLIQSQSQLSHNQELTEPAENIFIGACPSYQREIETVYQMILQSLKDDKSLELNDIALLIPNIEQYRPYILNVFERDRDELNRPLIPYNLSDYSASRTSFFSQGIESILKLIEGDFARSDVFDILLNPCFGAAKKIDRSTAIDWLNLVNQLQIYRYYDQEERQGQTDMFSWYRGLRKLYLGLFLEVDYKLDDGLTPHSLIQVDRTNLTVLIGIIEELNSWRQKLSKADLLGSERLEVFLKCVDSLLAALPNDYSDQKIRPQLEQDLLQYNSVLFDDATLFKQSILDSLSSLKGSSGKYLAGGLTICSLQPMRPVPFRHIYIAGLGEGQFPPKERRSSLDLLYQDRLLNNNDDKPESAISSAQRARLLLFETVLSAKERLTFLYRNRDTAKDRDLLPCSTLLELKSYLKIEEIKLPLNLYSQKYKNQKKDLLELGANLSDVDLRISYQAGVDSKAAVLLQSDSLELQEITQVDIKELVRYLKNPVEQIVKTRLRLSDSTTDDISLNDDEPIHIGSEQIYNLDYEFLNRCIHKLVADSKTKISDLIQRVIQEIRSEYLESFPVEPFAEVSLRKFNTKNYQEKLITVHKLIQDYNNK